MILVYLFGFILLAIGIVAFLKITPEQITNDIMNLTQKEQTLRDKVLIAKGKKKSRKLTVELNRIRYALETTGKGKQFAIACSSSLFLMILGCVVAVMIDNIFLIPAFALAFAMIPYGFVKRTIEFYENHIQEELETALSIVTTSYIRSDDILTAVKENLEYLKPPVKDIFGSFIAENAVISANIKHSIKHLKEKVHNSIFAEWCDTLIQCQDDRTLKDTLMPIVSKFTDVRLANSEVKSVMVAARIEYYMMAGMLVSNIPILYLINKDWYNALMYTTIGKIVLSICAMAILITFIFMKKFTKPIVYRK